MSSTILVVEDDKDQLSVITRLLQEAQYQVLAIPNGKGVLPLLEAGQVDLVLTDLVMPEKDGLEVLLEMRRNHGAIPVVAMSAWGRRSAGNYLKTAQAYRPRAILEKPFTKTELLDVIAGALAPVSSPLPA